MSARPHLIDGFKSFAHGEKHHAANEPRTLEAILEAGQADARAEVAKPRIPAWPKFPGEPMFSDEQLMASDKGRQQEKDADCVSFGQRAADRAQAAELQRLPLGGYLS